MTPPKKNKLKIANITSSERETLESLRDRLLGEIKTSTLRGTPSANVKPGFAIADEEFCDFYDCAPQEIFNPNYFTPHLSNVTNPYLQIKTSTNQTLEVAPGVYMYGY